jgi:hypothetical protein
VDKKKQSFGYKEPKVCIKKTVVENHDIHYCVRRDYSEQKPEIKINGELSHTMFGVDLRKLPLKIV